MWPKQELFTSLKEISIIYMPWWQPKEEEAAHTGYRSQPEKQSQNNLAKRRKDDSMNEVNEYPTLRAYNLSLSRVNWELDSNIQFLIISLNSSLHILSVILICIRFILPIFVTLHFILFSVNIFGADSYKDIFFLEQVTITEVSVCTGLS